MYQFSCRDCGQGFEKKLPMSQADAQQDCPGCGGENTKKVFGAIAIGGTSRSSSSSLPARPASSPFS
jgi:putative FmdB family regulatory protein